jgi:hypothetical protein
LDGNACYSGRLDLRNNVVYNWGHRATDGGAREVNFVGNYYKPGKATDFFYALNMQHEGTGLGKQQAYFSGNVMPGYFDEDNQDHGRKYTISNDAVVDWETFVETPFFESFVTTQTAEAAYKDVLSDVGCTEPAVDDHDTRVLKETLNGSYSYVGSVSGKAGLPDNEQDVGGYEDYPEIKRRSDWDSDGDGLPDWWERYYSLNVNSAKGDFSDANTIGTDGYTELNRYLQWMSEPHYLKKADDSVEIDLKNLFRGYTNSPRYAVKEVENGSAEIFDYMALLKPDSCGMASFMLSVTDAAGDAKEKKIVVFIYPKEGDI